MVLKANDRRTSSPCHDEFRGPRSDCVRQMLYTKVAVFEQLVLQKKFVEHVAFIAQRSAKNTPVLDYKMNFRTREIQFMSRRKQRSAFDQVSEFDKGRIVSYRDCGLSFREMGSRVG
ncbi:hypothetical protein TNCV_4641931 [Trichonephila clavipes]|nr:hypothetical protein TNCV_4641931 [Trichonephila clavipes]